MKTTIRLALVVIALTVIATHAYALPMPESLRLAIEQGTINEIPPEYQLALDGPGPTVSAAVLAALQAQGVPCRFFCRLHREPKSIEQLLAEHEAAMNLLAAQIESEEVMLFAQATNVVSIPEPKTLWLLTVCALFMARRGATELRLRVQE